MLDGRSLTVANPSKALVGEPRPRLRQGGAAASVRSACHLDWLNAENRRILLIVSIKMWSMVPRPGFAIHSNNDTEEAAKFGHLRILLSSSSRTQSGFDAAEFQSTLKRAIGRLFTDTSAEALV
jgi:hypothetical protein